MWTEDAWIYHLLFVYGSQHLSSTKWYRDTDYSNIWEQPTAMVVLGIAEQYVISFPVCWYESMQNVETAELLPLHHVHVRLETVVRPYIFDAAYRVLRWLSMETVDMILRFSSHVVNSIRVFSNYITQGFGLWNAHAYEDRCMEPWTVFNLLTFQFFHRGYVIPVIIKKLNVLSCMQKRNMTIYLESCLPCLRWLWLHINGFSFIPILMLL